MCSGIWGSKPDGEREGRARAQGEAGGKEAPAARSYAYVMQHTSCYIRCERMPSIPARMQNQLMSMNIMIYYGLQIDYDINNQCESNEPDAEPTTSPTLSQRSARRA